MGFLDRVKEQAATATAAAKDAAQKGQARLDSIQAKRAADALLRDLGAAHYAQHAGRATASTPSDITRLEQALAQHEHEHGPIDLGMEAGDGAGGAAAGAGTVDAGAAGASSAPPPPPTGQSV